MGERESHPERADAEPWAGGRTVGRYTLLAKLATGGMAEIFLARQSGPEGFQKLVVVKKILDTYAEDPDFVAMFLDEARIAAQLNHPNIVQIFDLGEERGAYYIAMEYLEGESVAMLARTCRKASRNLPPAIAAWLVSVAADALHYAHERLDGAGQPLGIVHRDISPQNLFVTYEGTLKVVDFGIAKAANRATRTQEGSIKGKLSYMSPEQARGEEVDGRSDVFALGIVLFELCTASSLFQFDHPMKTYSAIVGPGPIPRARERNPDLDPGLDAIIARALERDVSLRYGSGAELHRALEAWLRKEEAVGAATLTAFMASLFAERIAQRHLLVEKARQGADITSGVREISQRIETGPHPRSPTDPEPESAPALLEGTSPAMPLAPFERTHSNPGIPVLVPPGSVPTVTLPSTPSAPPSAASALPGAPRRPGSSPGLRPIPRVPTGSQPRLPANRPVEPAHRAGWVPWLAVALGVVAAGGAVAWSHRERPAPPPMVEVPVTPAVSSGILRVRTEPPLGRVVIDGVDRGTAPVSVSDLELGEHVIEAHLDGWVDHRRVVNLEHPGETLDLELALTRAPPSPVEPAPMAAKPGPPPLAASTEPSHPAPSPRQGEGDAGPRRVDVPVVIIDSIPNGCEVFSGTDLLGTTPLELANDFPTGDPVTVRIERRGYQNKEVTFLGGGAMHLKATLARR